MSRSLKTKPNSESKRIVILGASIGQGSVASTYANSWAGKFTTAMQANGYIVTNVSIGGNTSQNLIDRFYIDVAPYDPDFVIVAPALVNEGFPGNLNAIYTYQANAQRLIKMIEGIGAIPVIAGQYPNNSYSATACGMVRDVYSQFQKLGVQTWDFLDAATNGASCTYLSSLDSGDGSHPSDAGHQALYDAIPLTYFDVAYTKHASEQSVAPSSWTWSNSDGTNVPLSVTPDRSMDSWTVAVWIRDNGAGGKAAIGIARGTATLRVRNATGFWTFAENSTDTLSSSVNGVSNQWHHIVLSYNSTQNLLTFYIDGRVIGSTALSQTNTPTTAFYFLSRADSTGQATGYSMSEPVVYRAPLTASDILNLYIGAAPRKSLEFLSELNGAPGSAVANLADTASRGVTYGPSWTANLLGFARPASSLVVGNDGTTNPLVVSPIATTSPALLLVTTAGNVGIGTTSPWRTLSVSGTLGISGLTANFGAGSLCLTASKEIVYNAGSDNCLSSIRATKHDINPLGLSATSTIGALSPVSFIYNGDASSTVRYGFIAEDTAAVDPHLATYDQSGKITGVDDRAVLSVIVKALQDLIATIAGFADNFVSAHITATVGDFTQVNTQKLCVGGTCVTETEFKSLLQKQSVSPAPSSPQSPRSGTSSAPPAPSGVAISTATTTAEAPSIVPDYNATTTLLASPAPQATTSPTVEEATSTVQ